MNKIKLNCVIVVEGKTDKDKLLNLFDTEIITTNGSAINKQTYELIRKISLNKKVVLFLDPDYVGEKIRKSIINNLKDISFYNCFITKEDVLKNKKNKIGIAEASDKSIINAFKNLVEFKHSSKSISLEEYNSLNINSKQLRLKICNFLNISYCNNKQLLKRLNMMNIDVSTLKKVIENE